MRNVSFQKSENKISEYFISKYLRAQPNGMQSKVKQAYEV